jgi:long-chain fatty acid transport protein
MKHKQPYSNSLFSGPFAHVLVACLTMAGIGLPPSVHALGLRVPNQDPEAIGRANAFVATADNPSAIYYNPAGIAQLPGQNLQISSLAYLNVYAKYKSPAGSTIENDHEFLPVPAVHCTYTPDESDFSFGLGVYAPFGLSMKWPESASFRTSGIEGCLDYITINPVIAWKIHETLSIAAGPAFNISNIELRRGLIPDGSYGYTDSFKFDGDDAAWGFTLGLLWQPSEQWSVGASYRSAVKMSYDGTGNVQPSPPLAGAFPSNAGMDYPQIIMAGVSYRPTTNWNVEIDADWTDWNTFNDVTVAGAGTLPFHWRSSWMIGIGATRQLKNGWHVSAGYFFSQNTTPDLYYNPVVADTDLHVGTVGFGRKSEHWSWALACEIIGGPWNSVDNPADPTVAGKYKLFSPAVSAAIGYRF